MKEIMFFIILFSVYSIIGWLIEVINCSLKEKKFVMRGFLIGPYCPIYGFSAVLMIYLLERHVDDILVLFVMSAFIASFLEYITSYIMEKIFKIRWWDYSNKKFNINGRICLENSMLFGFLGLLLLTLINPLISNLIYSFSDFIIISLASIIMIIMITDTIVSSFVISKIKIDIDTIYKDYTEIIDKKIWELLGSSSFFKKRLLKAFPKLKVRKIK